MALGNWIDRIDGVDPQSAEDINAIAHAVLEFEGELSEYENLPNQLELFKMLVENEISNQNEKITILENKPQLPEVSSEDAGKFLRVSSIGNWYAEKLQIAEESEY